MSEEVERDEILNNHEFGPPKSLQKMENADILWQMIKKRFPNAAPLLCEMETVIDHADDLLQQLRIPCPRSPSEVSSLNNYVDSGESDEMISLICDESFPEDANVIEDVTIMTSTAKTQISESSISTIDTDFDSILSNRPSSSGEKFNNFKEDIKNEKHRNDNDNDSLKDIKEENKKNEENVEIEETKSFSNAKEEIVGRKIIDNVEENNKNTNSSGDWKDNVNVGNRYNILNNSQDKQMNENVDRININEGEIFGDDKMNNKTPWDILEDYANKCQLKIQYNCEKNKCNRFVITGKLSEFSATDCGDSENLIKNNIAKVILQNIADHQMNDKDMKQLLELSREQ
ncbi:hypothetical protein M0802_004759 [Mischocyttarus mexicanus]|nr:hypothetical protein M0802_004759 [Mischocyttarus mexicanus]